GAVVSVWRVGPLTRWRQHSTRLLKDGSLWYVTGELPNPDRGVLAIVTETDSWSIGNMGDTPPLLERIPKRVHCLEQLDRIYSGHGNGKDPQANGILNTTSLKWSPRCLKLVASRSSSGIKPAHCPLFNNSVRACESSAWQH